METQFKCDYCNINEKKFEYSSYVTGWYRNKSDSKYFCSKECLDHYENELVCYKCHYSRDLKKPESEIYVLCTKYPYNSSCYDNYMENKYGSIIRCIFCKHQFSDTISAKKRVGEYGVVYYCDRCHNIYKNIVINTNSEILDNECIFCCNILEISKKVNGRILCENCYLGYKKLALDE
jgi:hypothetical protein